MSSIEQKFSPADPTIDPQGLVLEQDRAYFREHGMVACKIGRWPLELDVSKMTPLEEHDGNALLGVIDVAGTAVQFYGRVNNEGKYSGGYLGLTRSDKDIYTDRDVHGNVVNAEQNAERWTPLFLNAGHGPQIFGRSQEYAHALGIDSNDRISRKHFGITLSPNGTLKIEDYSANGTRFITGVPEKAAETGDRLRRWLGRSASRDA